MKTKEEILTNMVTLCMAVIKSDPTYKKFSNGLNLEYAIDPLSNPEINLELNLREALQPFAFEYATQRTAEVGDGWISVEDRLPEEHKLRFSKPVLCQSGNWIDSYQIRSYDYELNRWTGSPHVLPKLWQDLPKPGKWKRPLPEPPKNSEDGK